MQVDYWDFLDREGQPLAFARMLLDGDEYQWANPIGQIGAPNINYKEAALQSFVRIFREKK